MKKIAIVGAGPTGIYTLFSLLQQQTPLSISVGQYVFPDRQGRFFHQ